MAARQGALAAGAARASGERARRRSTPLIGAEPITPVDDATSSPDAVTAAAPTGSVAKKSAPKKSAPKKKASSKAAST
jgi:hypothetical protein